MPISNSTLDKLVWVLIYGGLFAVGLGLWMMEHHDVMGWSAFVAGLAACAGGAVLIWVRSRRP